MQEIDNRIPPIRIRVVTRWQVDENIPVGGIAFQISFKRFAVHHDVLDSALVLSKHRGSDAGERH